MLAATIARTPVRVYHVRGLPFVTASGARRLLLRGTEQVSCRLAQRVFCVSPSLREVALTGESVEAAGVLAFRPPQRFRLAYSRPEAQELVSRIAGRAEENVTLALARRRGLRRCAIHASQQTMSRQAF